MLSALLWPTLLLLSPSLARSDGLTFHNPTYYPILSSSGSHLACRYTEGGLTYGVDLEREAGDLVHVSVVTAGQSEGDRSAFDAKIVSQDFALTYLRFFKRDGDYGTYVEIEIGSQVSPGANYQLPARMEVSGAIYSTGGDGQEKEDLESNGMHAMGCVPPVLASRGVPHPI